MVIIVYKFNLVYSFFFWGGGITRFKSLTMGKSQLVINPIPGISKPFIYTYLKQYLFVNFCNEYIVRNHDRFFKGQITLICRSEIGKNNRNLTLYHPIHSWQKNYFCGNTNR